MRKIILGVLFLLLLTIPVSAEPLAALTFDDGPSGKYTRALLDGLEERSVNATFFLCGYRLEQYPELAERILSSGHEIGIHGYSHNNMAKMSMTQIAEEIRKTRALLPTGCEPVFFRPPGGLTTKSVSRAAAEERLALLHWDVDPKDWALHDSTSVISRVLDRVADGDVILLHDMSDSSVEAAFAIVDALTERGYRFVTASELAAIRNGAVSPGVAYSKFPPSELTGAN